MAESGQPLLPAPAWQAITQTTQPRDSQWLVGRRYLSESSIALVLANPTAPPSDLNSKSVRAFVLQTGGVQHHPPHRAQRSLSMAEREEISRGVAAGSRADRSPPGWGEQTLRSRDQAIIR